MPKNLLQDIVKVKSRREVRRITEIPKETPLKETPKQTPKIPRPETLKYTDFEGVDKQDRIRPRYSLWIVALISIVFFLFALSFLFTKAEVVANPKVKDLVLNENLSAVKDSNTAGLAFDLVVISGEETKKVAAGEEKEVALKSTGTVLVYNAFSSSPQKLNIDTRLEGSNGKIYKTTTSLTVPGMSGDGTPGSVAASIYAENAGEEYNSPPLDFKIFGFKGTPKYAKFYARSKGQISGGFKGRSPVISDVEKENTLSELKTALKAKLLKKATDQIPEGFILFKDAVFLNIDEEKIGFASEDNALPITTKGTLYGFLFNEQDLTKKIAQDNVEKYDQSEVYLPNIRDLVFSLSAPAGLANMEIPFSDVGNISFNLSGPAKIVWRVDSVKLTDDLLGKSKKDFNQILSQYPNIDSANVSLSPFWVRSFPGKSKDIKVIVNYPQ